MLALIRLFLCTRAALIAENLFLRKQLALFHERKRRPRRITQATRLGLMALAKFFDWRDALVVVKPETFIKWHKTAFRQFWRWKSKRRGCQAKVPASVHRHKLPDGHCIVSKAVLGGLHHEYRLEKEGVLPASLRKAA